VSWFAGGRAEGHLVRNGEPRIRAERGLPSRYLRAQDPRGPGPPDLDADVGEPSATATTAPSRTCHPGLLQRQQRHSQRGEGSFIRHDLGALLSGDYLTSFGLDRCCEELAAVTALAHQDGLSLELSEHVEQIYQRALARYGPANGELLAVAMMEEDAGVLLRRQPP
jgi:hypothetical protein